MNRERSDKRILQWFNRPDLTAEEICITVRKRNVDSRGKGRYPAITSFAARKIIEKRAQLPNQQYAQVSQLHSFGQPTGSNRKDLYYSLGIASLEYPLLLFPVRIETIFDGRFLKVRFYPDQILLDSHDPRLTVEEAAATKAYRTTVAADHSEKSKRSAWDILVDRFGSRRAAWLIQGDGLERGSKPHDWSMAPNIALLPTRFVVYLLVNQPKRKGENSYITYRANAKHIARDKVLPVLLNPELSDETTSLFDKAASWVQNFDDAVRVGMAVKIDLQNALATFSRNGVAESVEQLKARGFDRVIAAGVNNHLSPLQGQQTLEKIFQNHHYTDGLSFLPYGMPTNNTEREKSGFTRSKQDRLKDYYIENRQRNRNDYFKRFTDALGMNHDIFYHVSSMRDVDPAFDKHSHLEKELRRLIWTVTGGYFGEHLMNDAFDLNQQIKIWDFFCTHVYPSGQFPTFAIGNTPYGILPVTSLKEWTHLASPASLFPNELETQLLDKLRAFLPEWLKLSDALPKVGKGEDPDQVLLQILSMQPTISDFQTRPFMPDNLNAPAVQDYSSSMNNTHLPNLKEIRNEFNDIESDREYAKKELSIVLDQILKIPISNSDNFLLTALNHWEDVRRLDTPLIEPPNKPMKSLKHFLSNLVEFRISDEAHERMRLSFVSAAVLDRLGQAPPVREFQSGMYFLEAIKIAINDDQLYKANIGKILRNADRHFLQEELGNARSGLLQEIIRRALHWTHIQQKQIVVKYKDVPTNSVYTIDKLHSYVGQRVKADDVLMTVNTGIGLDRPRLVKSPIDGTVGSIGVSTGTHITSDSELAIVEYPNDVVRNRVEGSIFHLASYVLRNIVSVEQIETSLKLAFDGVTHRLDAWVSGVASLRLAQIRGERDQKAGLALGLYGWVENLKAEQVQDHENGYIHAPSVGQAASAAVMRNSFNKHSVGGGESAFALNLSSARVRSAIAILDGVRNGHDLAALLGYQFERALHERHLDHFIDNFRQKFPRVAHKVTPNENVDEPDAVAARSVVDGKALSDAWQADTQNFANVGIEGRIKNIEKIALREELNRLDETMDAVTDALMYESVHQLVQGNPERSAAAADAAAGLVPPPELQALRTHVPGVGMRNRVCYLFPQVAVPATATPKRAIEPAVAAWFDQILGSLADIGCQVSFANEIEESRVDEHPRRSRIDMNLASLADIESLPGIGPETAEAIVVRRQQIPFQHPSDLLEIDSIGNATLKELRPLISLKTTIVTLDLLGLDSIDLLYFAALPLQEQSGASDLEQLIAAHVRHAYHLEAGLRIEIHNADSPVYPIRLDDALELAKTCFHLVSGRAYIDPSHYVSASASEAAFSYEDFKELHQRVRNAYEKLSRLSSMPLSQEIAQDLVCFGISEAILPGPEDPDLHVREEVTAKETTKRLASAEKHISQARSQAEKNVSEALKQLIQAAKALFGRSLVVLPRFILPKPQRDRLQDVFANQEKMLGPDLTARRVELWLSQAAQTHKPLQDLESFLMYHDVWHPEAVDDIRLSVAQLPYEANHRWQALSNSELTAGMASPQKKNYERLRGSTGIVTLHSKDISLTEYLCGLLLDQWEEIIPDAEVTTGLSFEYQQPNAQAPNTLLLAVPPNLPQDKERPWSTDLVKNIISETMDLMRIRMVDIDAMDHLHSFFPLTFFSSDKIKRQTGFTDAALNKFIDSLSDRHNLQVVKFYDSEWSDAEKLAKKKLDVTYAWIDRNSPARLISSGLLLPVAGVRITFDSEIKLVLVQMSLSQQDSPVLVDAINGQGIEIAQRVLEWESYRQHLRVMIAEPGIQNLEITGGSGNAKIEKISFLPTST